MIKNFETYISEDYFSKLANRKDTGNVRRENKITEDFVRSFIDSNRLGLVRSINIRKEGNKIIVDVDGSFTLIKDAKEIPFQFGKVTGDFNCAECKNLTSLEGCPTEVGGNFYCSKCDNIVSLEGCPKKVGFDFKCNICTKLKSLKDGPVEVGGNFDCTCCDSLTSLKGCPQIPNGILHCSWCGSLTSLTGIPTKLDSLFAIGCGKQFTEEEVRKICNVTKKICV